MKNDAIDTKSLSTSNLIHEQNNDPEIAILIQQAFDEREISDQAMGYFIKNDILMRKIGDHLMLVWMTNGQFDTKLFSQNLTVRKYYSQ